MGRTSRVDIPEPTLRKLYVEDQQSTVEIAKMFGTTKKTVRLRLVEYGIPRRSLKQAFAVSKTHGTTPQKQKGKDNPRHKGRKFNMGYVQVYEPNHPEANELGYVFEHRLVAERMIGRPLHLGEEVHHENEQRDDNRPENLRVLTKSQHMALHARRRHACGGFKPRKEVDA